MIQSVLPRTSIGSSEWHRALSVPQSPQRLLNPEFVESEIKLAAELSYLSPRLNQPNVRSALIHQSYFDSSLLSALKDFVLGECTRRGVDASAQLESVSSARLRRLVFGPGEEQFFITLKGRFGAAGLSEISRSELEIPISLDHYNAYRPIARSGYILKRRYFLGADSDCDALVFCGERGQNVVRFKIEADILLAAGIRYEHDLDHGPYTSRLKIATIDCEFSKFDVAKVDTRLLLSAFRAGCHNAEWLRSENVHFVKDNPSLAKELKASRLARKGVRDAELAIERDFRLTRGKAA